MKVQIADFLLRELSLGAPVIGTAAQLTASGAASLGDPKEGLNFASMQDGSTPPERWWRD